MTVVAAQHPVSHTAPVLLADGDDVDGASVLLKNVTGSAAVYLGGSGVTSSTGFRWDPADGPLSIELERQRQSGTTGRSQAGEKLYAITASGDPDQTVHVLLNDR